MAVAAAAAAVRRCSWRGRRGAVAAVEYSNADLARQVARETRSRAGRWLVAAPALAGGAGDRRAWRGRRLASGSRRSQASGIDIDAGGGCVRFDAVAGFQGQRPTGEPRRCGEVRRREVHRGRGPTTALA